MITGSPLRKPGTPAFTLVTDGFVFGVYRLTLGPVPIVVLDQDWIHGGKKFVNVFASGSQVLQLGPTQSAGLALLRRFVVEGSWEDHDIKDSHLERAGFVTMYWSSAVRLFATKALTAMKGDTTRAPYLKGSIRFLGVVRNFVSIFTDDGMTYLERVRRAGFVTTYMCLWRGWVQNTPDQTIEPNFVTREGIQDAFLPCHMMVILIKMDREYFPDIDLVFDRLGTDVYEDFFSSLGSFSMNKRTYSILETIETARSKIRIQNLRPVDT
jgi:hypothetical protein